MIEKENDIDNCHQIKNPLANEGIRFRRIMIELVSFLVFDGRTPVGFLRIG